MQATCPARYTAGPHCRMRYFGKIMRLPHLLAVARLPAGKAGRNHAVIWRIVLRAGTWSRAAPGVGCRRFAAFPRRRQETGFMPDRDRLLFLLLNVGHFLDHMFTLIFATVAALALVREWG